MSLLLTRSSISTPLLRCRLPRAPIGAVHTRIHYLGMVTRMSIIAPTSVQQHRSLVPGPWDFDSPSCFRHGLNLHVIAMFLDFTLSIATFRSLRNNANRDSCTALWCVNDMVGVKGFLTEFGRNPKNCRWRTTVTRAILQGRTKSSSCLIKTTRSGPYCIDVPLIRHNRNRNIMLTCAQTRKGLPCQRW